MRHLRALALLLLCGCGDGSTIESYTWPEICDPIATSVAELLLRCDAPCPVDGVDCESAAWIACYLLDGAEIADLVGCLRELQIASCDQVETLEGAPLCQALLGIAARRAR